MEHATSALTPTAHNVMPPIHVSPVHLTTSRMRTGCVSTALSLTAPGALTTTSATPAALHRHSPSTPTSNVIYVQTPTASCAQRPTRVSVARLRPDTRFPQPITAAKHAVM